MSAHNKRPADSELDGDKLSKHIRTESSVAQQNLEQSSIDSPKSENDDTTLHTTSVINTNAPSAMNSNTEGTTSINQVQGFTAPRKVDGVLKLRGKHSDKADSAESVNNHSRHDSDLMEGASNHAGRRISIVISIPEAHETVLETYMGETKGHESAADVHDSGMNAHGSIAAAQANEKDALVMEGGGHESRDVTSAEYKTSADIDKLYGREQADDSTTTSPENPPRAPTEEAAAQTRNITDILRDIQTKISAPEPQDANVHTGQNTETMAQHVRWRTNRLRELNQVHRTVFNGYKLSECEKAQIKQDVETVGEQVNREMAEKIAAMEERLRVARERKASLIREQKELDERKWRRETERDEAIKGTVELLNERAAVQDDSEDMQYEMWDMALHKIQSKIDGIEVTQDSRLAERFRNSDEHQEKVYNFALQEQEQLQNSAYEADIQQALHLRARAEDRLEALEDRWDELDRIDSGVNNEWDNVNEKKREVPAAIEELTQLITKKDAIKDLYGKMVFARNRASEDLRASCAEVFENNMEIRRQLRKTHYDTRMLRLQLPPRERKPLLKLQWRRKHILNLESYLLYVDGKKRVLEREANGDGA